MPNKFGKRTSDRIDKTPLLQAQGQLSSRVDLHRVSSSIEKCYRTIIC